MPPCCDNYPSPRPCLLHQLGFLAVREREARQVRELLSQVAARRLHLRKQRIERVELREVASLQRTEAVAQPLALIADVGNGRLEAVVSPIEHAAGRQIRVEQGVETVRNADIGRSEQTAEIVEVGGDRGVELRVVAAQMAVEIEGDADLRE